MVLLFRRRFCVGGLLAAALLAHAGCVAEAEPEVRSDWPMVRGDFRGTGYSPLSEITADNVADLAPAWSFSLLGAAPDADAEPRSAFSQATPIVIDDVMFLPTADAVVALDPTTGSEVWRHGLPEGRPSRRGVAYWPGEAGLSPRILFTSGRRLVALDAGTGELVPEFGDSGEIDLVVPYLSVPLVYENVVVVGANTPRGAIGGVGNARAFDARTGEKRWEFSSVPQPGSLGHDTWDGDSWKGRLGVNAWPFYFTMDIEKGLIYLPLAAPVPWAYGGDRQGANLFGNSIVAVDISSGEYAWHFQTIHHDLWDHDPPAPPVLFDVEIDGRTVAALAVTTKSGYLYILDRQTGDPIFGVEERPVPASDVPGEHAFPTQPFPSKPQGLARTSYEAADLVTASDTSAEHATACADLVESVGEIYNGGAFSPWASRVDEGSAAVTLLFPGLAGGFSWGGVAFDPASRTLLAFSHDVGTFGWMEEAPEGFPVPYDRRGPRPSSFDVDMAGQRWPCQKPPWGLLSAIDAATGEIIWQRPLGVTEGLPAAKQNTGRRGRAGAIVTAGGLMFIAATDDNRLRALDIATGDELWVTRLEQRGNANPMTYRGADDRQYVVVAAIDQVIAFRLP